MRKPRRVVRPCLDRLDDRCLPSGFTVAQVTHAYGLDAITFRSASGQPVAGDGTGETIALIEAYHDPNLASDLHVFDQANGLADPSLSVVNQAGGKTNAVWASEESLDVEWAHAIAPAPASWSSRPSPSRSTDLVQAVDVARNTPGVVAVSMSWGFNESAGETAFDSHFLTPAGHQGITFVASSGDSGTANGPEYPSSSPRVVAVGGTTLAIDRRRRLPRGGRLVGQRRRLQPLRTASPAFRRAVQTSAHRSTPDVAFDADPYSGVEVYETPPGGSVGSWLTVGGTSLGTPAWAAIIAIVDQGRALEGKGSLDGPTQTLPALYSLPSTDFHTVFTPPPFSPWGGGVNPFGYSSHGWPFLRHAGKVRAGSSAKANINTGLGSPVGPRLVADLVASDVSEPLPSSAGHHGSKARAASRRRITWPRCISSDAGSMPGAPHPSSHRASTKPEML